MPHSTSLVHRQIDGIAPMMRPMPRKAPVLGFDSRRRSRPPHGRGRQAALDLGGVRLIDRVDLRRASAVPGRRDQSSRRHAGSAGALRDPSACLCSPTPLPGHAGPLAGVLAGLDHAAENGFHTAAQPALRLPLPARRSCRAALRGGAKIRLRPRPCGVRRTGPSCRRAVADAPARRTAPRADR